MPFVRPLSSRRRSLRAPFHPVPDKAAPYRLSRDVLERLVDRLAPFRNREAALTLAVFIARYWSAPGRVSGSFPIDRRALVDHHELELTERRIRSAIATLEAVGFLDRALTSGSTFKATEHGLRKKPIKFVFGSDFAPLFIAANSRAAAARGGRPCDRRPVAPSPAPRPSTALPEGSGVRWPKSRISSEKSLLLGHVKKGNGIPPKAFEPDPALEAALERLKQGFRQAEGSKTGGAK